MKFETLKNELTQERIKRKKGEQTINELNREIKKLKDVLIKINGLSMRTINDAKTQRLD